MSRTEPPRIAVLGAGPIGIECALYAASPKLPFRVYERGGIGENFRRWGHVKLFTPWGMNTTPLGRAILKADSPRRDLPADGDLLTGREHVAAYLEPLAASPMLANRVESGCTVLRIGRKGFLKEESPGDGKRAAQPFRLLVRAADGRERVEEADLVLDCTGTYGNPRHLGDGGIPAVGELALRGHIAWGVEDVLGEKRDHYAGRTVLVVGAGHSAATTVCNLAALAEKHPETWTIWLARGAGTQPLRRQVNDPLRERDALCARANALATRGEGNVEFHAPAVVEAIEPAAGGFTVRARVAGQERSWQVERLIANVGYEPDNALYRELQVHECYATLGPMALATGLAKHAGGDGLAIGAQGAAALRHPEPNFYVLGAKSYGRNSNFLLRTGFE